MHRRHRHSRTFRPIGILIPAAAGTFTAVCIVSLLALISLRFLDDMRYSAILSSAACLIGSFSGAYLGGKYRRRRGIIEGALCGLLMYAVFSAAGLVLTGSPAGIKKLLLLTVSGAAGGVCGVNSKRPKRLME